MLINYDSLYIKSFFTSIDSYFSRELLELERKCTEKSNNSASIIKIEKDSIATTT